MIDIIIEKEHVYRSKRGAITAPVYFDFGNFKFPEEGWSDFIVVIGCWWLDSISKLIKGWESEIELCFMDGPMLIKLTMSDGNNILLECIDQGGRSDVIEYQKKYTLDSITKALLSNSNSILRICSENNWCSDDIDNLAKLNKSVSELRKRQEKNGPGKYQIN